VGVPRAAQHLSGPVAATFGKISIPPRNFITVGVRFVQNPRVSRGDPAQTKNGIFQTRTAEKKFSIFGPNS